MARVATPNLGLGTWTDGENPGAGSQSVIETGLNANFLITDQAVGSEHNADGTHKSAVIDKGNLKTTVCDGSTIEKDGTVGLRIKDAGVTSAKLGALAVIAGKIANSAIDAASLIVDGIITGAKMAASTITGSKIAANTVAASNLTHDNSTRKNVFGFTCETQVIKVGGISLSSNLSAGYPAPRAGHVTKIAMATIAGAQSSASFAYATSGNGHFSVGDRLGLQRTEDVANTYFTLYVNGSPVSSYVLTVAGDIQDAILTLEVENDD